MDQLLEYLQLNITADLDIQRDAVEFLIGASKQEGFAGLLFEVMTEEYPLSVKIAAAVNFRTFIYYNWGCVESKKDIINLADREFIKANIIELIFNIPEFFQNEILESLKIIAKGDFLTDWPTLVPQLVKEISERNNPTINVALRICDLLFERYRIGTSSDEIWVERNELINQIGKPLFDLIEQTMELIKKDGDKKEEWSSINTIINIFLSLNHQCPTEYLKENMVLWMDQFILIFKDKSQPPKTNDDEEVSILEKVRSSICEIMTICATNWNEEFDDYITVFMEAIDDILVTTERSPKFDSLVTNALCFLRVVADRHQHQEWFEIHINRLQFCQKIIIPNIEFRQFDEKLFKDNSEEFIRLNIEGSRIPTRRNSACSLTQSLCQRFERLVVSNFIDHIEHQIRLYNADQKKNWELKDNALALMTSVASREEHDNYGVTSTTASVDLIGFYRKHVLQELRNSTNGHPIVKCGSIKFLANFRSMMGPEDLRLVINLLPTFLSSESRVVRSYAASAINKLLMVRYPRTNTTVISGKDFTNPTGFLIVLCDALNIELFEDNHYVMQAIMRTINTLQDLSSGYVDEIIQFVCNRLQNVTENPLKLSFYRPLCETLGICIKLILRKNRNSLTKFEWETFPLLNQVLNTAPAEHFEEMIPSIFEVTKPFLDLYTDAESYRPICPLLEQLQSCLEKMDNVSNIDPIVDVFLRLNRSSSFYWLGFSIINSTISHVPFSRMKRYLRPILKRIFEQLNQNKPKEYLKEFLIFFSVLVYKYLPDDIILLIDEMGSNMFSVTVNTWLEPAMRDLMTEDAIYKKYCSMGMIRMLTMSSQLTTGVYIELWQFLFDPLVKIVSNNDDVNARQFFARSLQIFSSQSPNEFRFLFDSLDKGLLKGVNKILATIGSLGVK